MVIPGFLELASFGINIGLIYNPERILFNPFDDTNFKNIKLIESEIELKNFLNLEKSISPKTFLI